MPDALTPDKPLVLLWTSQNGEVTLERGAYDSINEASADLPAASARLEAEYPSSADFHYPHDIKAGRWRVVPREPRRSGRSRSSRQESKC
jgi:hypothetical protein